MSGPAPRPFPLHAGIADVVAVRPVTPRMRRITLAATAFADFGVEQPGEIVTLGWPLDGEPLVLPQDGWRFAGGATQHWRNFTVRAHDRAAGTIDVDFFVHGDVGRASAWAGRAASGDTVGFAGPRLHWQPDPDATWSLLVADETGLPALLAILETLPAGHRAIALAEVQDEAERQPVQATADVALHWVSRAGREPGSTTVLAEAIGRLELPEAPGQAWAGGEALAMRGLRRHLTERAPQAVRAMSVLGYWKHRSTPADVVSRRWGPPADTY